MKIVMHLLSFAGGLILSSCVTLYKPNTIHSPLLKHKGEANTSALLGLSGSGLANLQAAYAISNHTGLMIDGMYHNKRSKSNDSITEKLNILFVEAGAGYFTTFGSKENRLFQCYAGGGYGNTTDIIHDSNPINPEANAKYFNLFIQPGIAYLNKGIEVALDLRGNYVRMFDINASLYDKFEWWNTNFKYYSHASLDFMNLEPNITLKTGNEKIKGILQLGLIIPTINSKSYFDVNTSSMLIGPLIKFSLGLSYSFGTKN